MVILKYVHRMNHMRLVIPKYMESKSPSKKSRFTCTNLFIQGYDYIDYIHIICIYNIYIYMYINGT